MQRNATQGVTIAILFLGWLLSYFNRFVINIALPYIGREFHVGPSAEGLLLSVFFAGYSIAQIPGGWLADRVGARRVMVFSVIMLSTFTALTGFAWSFAALLVLRFMFGLAEGGFPSAAFRALSEYFPKEKRSKIQAVLLSANPLALVLAPSLGALLTVYFSWRGMFVTVACVGIMIAALFIWVLPKTGTPAKPPSTQQDPLRSVLRSTAVWKLCAINFALNVLIWGFLSWLPTFLLRAHGLDLLHVGLYASIPGVTGIIGMLVGGWLSDSWFAQREKTLFIGAVLVCTACLVGILNVTSLPAVLFCQGLIAFSLKLAFIAIWSLPLKFEDSAASGSTAGIINMGSQFAGVVSPAVMGLLIAWGHGSFSGAFSFLIGCGAACVAIACTLRISTESGSGETGQGCVIGENCEGSMSQR
jgi:predicted MFS family arabinose efflux permease